MPSLLQVLMIPFVISVVYGKLTHHQREHVCKQISSFTTVILRGNVISGRFKDETKRNALIDKLKDEGCLCLVTKSSVMKTNWNEFAEKVVNRMQHLEGEKTCKGFILTEFPTNKPGAIALDKMLARMPLYDDLRTIDHVITIDVGDKELSKDLTPTDFIWFKRHIFKQKTTTESILGYYNKNKVNVLTVNGKKSSDEIWGATKTALGIEKEYHELVRPKCTESGYRGIILKTLGYMGSWTKEFLAYLKDDACLCPLGLGITVGAKSSGYQNTIAEDIGRELDQEKCKYGFALMNYPKNNAEAVAINEMLAKRGKQIDNYIEIRKTVTREDPVKQFYEQNGITQIDIFSGEGILEDIQILIETA